MQHDILIGKPAGSVSLNIAAAFWQSRPAARVSLFLLSCATLVMLSLTVLGAVGVFDKN